MNSQKFVTAGCSRTGFRFALFGEQDGRAFPGTTLFRNGKQGNSVLEAEVHAAEESLISRGAADAVVELAVHVDLKERDAIRGASERVPGREAAALTSKPVTQAGCSRLSHSRKTPPAPIFLATTIGARKEKSPDSGRHIRG